jgi:hypothetical protein
MIRPTNNPVTLPFGATTDPYSPVNPHRGTDFSYKPDDTIYMPESAVVTLVRDNGNDGNGVYFKAGNRQHGLLHTSQYLVKQGEWVEKGRPVAIMGDTGAAIGRHLHWALRVNGSYVDPLTLVDEQGEDMATTEEILRSALYAANAKNEQLEKTNEILQSALNDSRKQATIYESALNVERKKTAELEEQLEDGGNARPLAAGIYKVT